MIDTISQLALFLAQDNNSGGGQGGGGGGLFGGSPFVMIGLMIVMFYFIAIRPQQKQRKEQQARIEAMKEGDRVVTTAGIHAIVHRIKDKTAILKLAEGTMVEFDKQAIIQVRSKGNKQAAKKESSDKGATDMTKEPKQ